MLGVKKPRDKFFHVFQFVCYCISHYIFNGREIIDLESKRPMPGNQLYRSKFVKHFFFVKKSIFLTWQQKRDQINIKQSNITKDEFFVVL